MSELSALNVEPLSAAAFAPFGDMICDASAKARYPVNDGTALRYHDLAEVDTSAHEGRTLLSLFRAQPRVLPFRIELLERHPLGSQAFIPLDPRLRYLVVVAESPDHPPRAFLAKDGHGVNFHRGVWHHPLLALDVASDFLVIDRGGAGDNCDEVRLTQAWTLDLA